MNEHMNPDYPRQRGCFIEESDNEVKVVDYPTWTNNAGRYVYNGNASIPAGNDISKSFKTKNDALDFCTADNYVVCAYPKSDEELAELARKRAEWYATNNIDPADDDPFADYGL